ncbi:putative CCR4-NOT transcription complex subunit 4 [Balamuthia mandrillaris]
MEGPRRSKRKAANRQEYNQQQALEHVIGGKRFYSLLGVDPTYTARDIHKAYHELAGRYRPTDTAFLARLREAYEILVNPKSKALYDEACKFCTEKMGRGSWKFRTQNLARCYRGSSVEQEDVLQAYNETKGGLLSVVALLGDMNKLLQSVMFSTWRDKPRFISTIQEGIVNKELEAYDKFKQTIAKDGCRLRQQKEEGEEEEEEEKEEGQEEEEEQEQEQGEKKRRKRKERAIKGRRNGSATTIRRSTTKKRRMSKSKETH